jgi:hypothetical protein
MEASGFVNCEKSGPMMSSAHIVKQISTVRPNQTRARGQPEPAPDPAGSAAAGTDPPSLSNESLINQPMLRDSRTRVIGRASGINKHFGRGL